MKISFDPGKRQKVLEDRGLDFEAAQRVFDGLTIEFIDNRQDYGEERLVTIGFLNDRMVVLVSTLRDGGRHIISMRKANAREQRNYGERLDRSG